MPFGDLPFGVPKTNIYIFRPDSPKRKHWPIFRRDLDNFASKRPLQWRCLHVNYSVLNVFLILKAALKFAQTAQFFNLKNRIHQTR